MYLIKMIPIRQLHQKIRMKSRLMKILFTEKVIEKMNSDQITNQDPEIKWINTPNITSITTQSIPTTRRKTKRGIVTPEAEAEVKVGVETEETTAETEEMSM